MAPSAPGAPVVVVGAGPTGLSLTWQLGRAGVPVVLVEASPDFSRQVRGSGLMPSGLEALAQMGLGDLVAGLPHRALGGWQVWIEGRRLFRVAEPMGQGLQPCTLVPLQLLLEELLERCLRWPSVVWRPGATFSDLLWHGDAIQGIRLVGGEELPAALVVGADGRHSRLRRAAGLELHERGGDFDLLWFTAPAPPPEVINDDFLTLVGQGQIASVLRTVEGNLDLGWVCSRNRPAAMERSARAWAESFAALAPPRLGHWLLHHAPPLDAPRRFRQGIALVKRWHRPGLLLLGDAAHPMAAIRAQGINLALRDSQVAATQLVPLWQRLACSGQAHRDTADLNQALERIQARRQGEVERLQNLQIAEWHQGKAVATIPGLSRGLALVAPLLGGLTRILWCRRQGPLRQGLPAGLVPPAIDPGRLAHKQELLVGGQGPDPVVDQGLEAIHRRP